MDTNQSPEDLLTEKEVAAWLKCSCAALRKWRLLGKGPTFRKPESFVRYCRGDVQAWLDENTFLSTTRRAEPANA